MPIYPRRGGDGFRVTCYKAGRQYERICRGTRAEAKRLEGDLQSLLRGVFAGDLRGTWPASAGVYVIQVGPLGELDPVKIGTSTNVRERLEGLQTGLPWPIRLLFVLDGDRDREGIFQRRFASCRTLGEWFQPNEEMQRWLEENRTRWSSQRRAMPKSLPDSGTLAKTVEIPEESRP